MLASDHVVLARPDLANPFRYTVVERLAGSGTFQEIPYLVDSRSRRRLASDAGTSVLFARDAADGSWNRAVFVDSAMEPVVRHVMKSLPDWSQPSATPRIEFFAELADHPNATIHQMALRELDLAPYDLLRKLPIAIDPARLMRPLNDPTQQQLKPIRILLLGLSEDESVPGVFAAGLDNQVRVDGSTLGAYATALIELEGVQAVNTMIAPYLTDSGLSLLAREVLIQAMGMHADTDDAALHAAIVSSVRVALEHEPSLVGAVVRNFGWRVGQ